MSAPSRATSASPIGQTRPRRARPGKPPGQRSSPKARLAHQRAQSPICIVGCRRVTAGGDRGELPSDRFRDRILGRAVERANANRAQSGLPELPDITPHSMRRTWATFAAMVGRDPKWIAAQIGHTDPEFTFSVYQQIATRRFIDEQAVWAVVRFADEPAQRITSRQVTRVTHDDSRASHSVSQFSAEKGEFDQFLADLNDPTMDWNDGAKPN
jgi:Phage integrase family